MRNKNRYALLFDAIKNAPDSNLIKVNSFVKDDKVTISIQEFVFFGVAGI